MSGAINKSMLAQMERENRLEDLEEQGPGVFFGDDYLFQPLTMIGFDKNILNWWNKISTENLGRSMNARITKFKLWSIMLQVGSFHRDPRRVVLLPVKIERTISYTDSEMIADGNVDSLLGNSYREMRGNLELYNSFIKKQLKKRGFPQMNKERITNGMYIIGAQGIEYYF